MSSQAMKVCCSSVRNADEHGRRRRRPSNRHPALREGGLQHGSEVIPLKVDWPPATSMRIGCSLNGHRIDIPTHSVRWNNLGLLHRSRSLVGRQPGPLCPAPIRAERGHRAHACVDERFGRLRRCTDKSAVTFVGESIPLRARYAAQRFSDMTSENRLFRKWSAGEGVKIRG